jgi:hypothetical protein
MSTVNSIDFFPTVTIIRESPQAILPKLLFENSKKSFYELKTYKNCRTSIDGRLLTDLRIYIPDNVICKQKTIFFNILSTEEEEEEMKSEKVIREEIILPNDSFYTLSSPSNYGIEVEARNLITKTKLTTYLIFNKEIYFKEVRTPSKKKF